MIYTAPNCFICKLFRGAPDKYGDIATCDKYRRGIPQRIYPKGGICEYFTAKEPKVDGRRKK